MRVIALALLVAFSCAVRSAPPSDTKLIIALDEQYVGSALVVIASKLGYFRDAGLEVRLDNYPTGAQALNASLTGGADLATAASAPIALAVMRGAAVSIVATISVSGHDQGIVARKDSGIAKPEDLKGKRIAATPGTSGHYALEATLIANRIPPGAVQLVALPPDQSVEALSQGRVDAASLWEPYLYQAQRALGGDAIVFLAERQFHRTTFNLAGRREFVAVRPAAMERVLRALLEAERFAARRPQEARALYAQASGIEPQEVERLWPKYELALQLEQSLLNLLESQGRWILRYGYAPQRRTPNFLEVVDLAAITKVKPQAVSIIR